MEDVSVEIDLTGITAAFDKAPDQFKQEIQKAGKECLTDIQREARMSHRYVTHTATLERSVQTEWTSYDEGGKVYLDTGIAVYGPPTHEGHGTWSPDRFLIAAAERKRPEIIEKMKQAVAIASTRFGGA